MQYLCLHIHPNTAQVHLFAKVFKLYNRDATIQLSPWFNTFCGFWFSSVLMAWDITAFICE